MMKTRTFLSAFFALLLGAGLSAQTIVLDYVDGTVEARTKTNTWQAVQEGAQFTPDAVLRLSGGALAELSSGTLKLHLGKDGTYQLSTVLAQAKQKPDSNLASLAGSKIDKLLGNNATARVEVANMGARGAEKSSTDALAWAGDDDTYDGPPAAGPLETIDDQIGKKDWNGALKTANTALAANPDDPQPLLFDKARILAAMGRAAAALKALKDAGITQGEDHYMEAALLTGSQGLEAQDYDLVLAKTAEALKLNPDVEIAQNLTLAQALAWRGKGDAAKAKDLLNAVVKLGPKTPTGLEAARLGGQ